MQGMFSLFADKTCFAEIGFPIVFPCEKFGDRQLLTNLKVPCMGSRILALCTDALLLGTTTSKAEGAMQMSLQTAKNQTR
jgi:hypothetical protein